MMGRAVLFLMAGGFISFATIAAAECYCDTNLPVFEEDPLVFADEGLISFVAPAMVHIELEGKCAVHNGAANYEGEVLHTFFLDRDEYGQVQIFTDDYSSWEWVNMIELNNWALAICSAKRLIF